MQKLRIVFMGTPEFAVASLEALVLQGYNVVAVVTAPDKPQGRGQKIVYSPVKECATTFNIPVLQPPNLKAAEFLSELKSYRADLQIVVAFRMLPESVWAMPEKGTINLHASLLPQYRGAAPIHWAIINGEKETGVTTFFLKHEIDTGSIIYQEAEPIHHDDNVGTLYERLRVKGSGLVLKTVDAIQRGSYPAMAQTSTDVMKHAPKIFRETCEINWETSSESVRNFVRGLNPFPAAWSLISGKVYKIFLVSSISLAEAGKPGEIRTDNSNFLYVKSSDGWVSVDELQPEGKRKMNIKDFFRGNKI
jgi:methionyl-tRNA formyltransferase